MKLLNINPKQSYGVEIEYANVEDKKIRNRIISNFFIYKWNYHQEISICHDAGSKFTGEIVSPILNNNYNSLQQINEACNVLKDLGAIVTPQCGGHIHFDSKILERNGRYFQNLLILYLAYENVIYKYASGKDNELRESIGDYATPLLPYIDNGDITNLLQPYYPYEDFIDDFVRGHSRNVGLNLRQLLRGGYNTIEFRMPNGTLDSEIWFNNINTFGLLIEHSKKMTDEERDILIDKIIAYKKNPIDYYLSSDDEALRFIEKIALNEEDKTRFIKQYQKKF